LCLDGSFETKAISDFVSENKLPLVITFSHETADLVFDSDIKNQLLLFSYPAEFEKMRGNYEAAAKSFKKKIVFVFVDLSDVDAASPVLEFFGLDNEKTRLLAFVAERIISNYLYDGDYSADSLKQFSEKFLARDLTPYLKSQKAPAENAGPVKIVVSSTFEEIVLDETKDVILEIHAPWCTPCKTLEPEYNKLGEALKNIPSIVVARIDATKNEVEGLKMNEYPMVLFYPAAKNAEPTSVGARTAARFIEFLKSNAKVPFEAPQISEPEPLILDVKDEL
jgi:protein disulfide-isomerase A1